MQSSLCFQLGRGLFTSVTVIVNGPPGAGRRPEGGALGTTLRSEAESPIPAPDFRKAGLFSIFQRSSEEPSDDDG